MKERLIALLSAILIAVSFTMPVYAAVAVTPDMVAVAYDLLGSMGVIAAMEGTHAQKYDSVKDWITSPNANVSDMLAELEGFGTITTTDTGTRDFRFDLDADLERIGELLGNLYTSVADYISSSISSAFPIPVSPGNIDTSYTGRVELGSASQGIYWITTSGNGNWRYYGMSSDLTTIDYTLFADGTITYGSVHGNTYLYSDSFSGYYNVFTQYGQLKLRFGIGSSPVNYTLSGTTTLEGDGGVAICAGDTWVQWGDIGTIPADNVGDNFDKEALIPADVWVGGFTDSLARGQDVVLRLPDSLAGYDHVSDVYAPDRGLVSGLDIPGYVDAELGYTHTGTGEGELTEDLAGVVSGIGSIGNKLSDILSKLSALPALIGAAVIGTGSLDLSGFRDLDLSTVFPFCIPFDLYNCFTGFNATPIEPKFTVNFAGSALAEAGTVELDLTKFEVVFEIVRYFAFAGFVVGLILVTRQLVRG